MSNLATRPPSKYELLDGSTFPTNDDAMEFIGTVLKAPTEYSIIGTDIEGRVHIWNPGAQRLYGYGPQEMMGRPSSVLHTPKDVKRGLPGRMFDGARRDGKWEGAVERLRKDGGTFPARVVMMPQICVDGKLVGFVVMSKEISDEVHFSRADDKFRGLLESARDAIVIIDESGEIMLANAQTENLFGHTRADLTGRPVQVLIPNLFHDRHPEHRVGFFDEPADRPMGTWLDLLGVRKDGTELPVEISLSPLETEEGVLATVAIRDVTERKLVEGQLRETNAQLEMASQAKDRFLASMSHELRTPLNAILGFTGTMLMELPGPLTDDQRKQLETVQANGKHLLSIINDLLDLTKIESGKIEIDLEPVSCQDVLDEIVTGLRPLAEQKGIRLDLVAPDEVLMVLSDRRSLNQIMINLVNNAIKFTDEGSVCIELARNGENGSTVTRLSVLDTGMGIKPEDQGKLFAAFEQVETSATRRYEGTGLGLYISHKLTSLIHGALSFESKFGTGSKFTLTLSERGNR